MKSQSKFKMDCKYLNDELMDKEICCPVCGLSEKFNIFCPEEVIEEDKKMALIEAEQMIADALRGINSKYIKVKSTPVQRVSNICIY